MQTSACVPRIASARNPAASCVTPGFEGSLGSAAKSEVVQVSFAEPGFLTLLLGAEALRHASRASGSLEVWAAALGRHAPADALPPF